MLKAIETKQREDGSRAGQKRHGKSFTSRLIAVGFLVLPSLVFGERLGSTGAPVAGRIDLHSNDLAARIDRAFTPIFLCLIVVLCIVVKFDTDSEGIQPGSQRTPESRTWHAVRP